MSDAKHNLSLVVQAVDKATAPIRAMTVRIHKSLAPLNALSERMGRLGSQVAGLGKALNLPGLWGAAKGFGGALHGVGSAAFDLVGKLTAIGLAGGTAFLAIAKGAMDAGDKLGEVSQRVGLTVDTFAALQFAAAQSDVDAEAFATAMDQLNKRMGEMKVGKGGEFLHFLNEISPTFARQMKGAKSTEEALALLTDAFSKIEDPGKRATLAAHAFGKSGLQMGVFLAQGWKPLSETADRYRELVGSQEEFARVSGELDNATRETETAFTGLRAALATGLFPALTKISNALTGFLVKHRDGIAKWAEQTGAKISAWVESGGIDRLVTVLGEVADTIGRVVRWLGPMGTALASVGVLAAPLIASLGTLAVSTVTLAVQALPLLTAAGTALWPVLVSVGSTLGGVLTTVGTLAIEFVPFLAAIAGVVLAAKAIRDNWGDLSLLFENFGDTLRWTVIGAWEEVKPILEKLSGFFGGGTLNPFGSALAVGEALVPRTPGTMRAAPSPEYVTARSERTSRVAVDFSNLPRGARVTSDPRNTAPFDLTAGWSMVTP